MAPARILLTTARAAAARRAFSAAPARFDAATASIGATPLPVVRKPVGALRGGYVNLSSAHERIVWLMNGTDTQALRLLPRKHPRGRRHLHLRAAGLQGVERLADRGHLRALLHLICSGVAMVAWGVFLPSSSRISFWLALGWLFFLGWEARGLGGGGREGGWDSVIILYFFGCLAFGLFPFPEFGFVGVDEGGKGREGRWRSEWDFMLTMRDYRLCRTRSTG